MILKNFQMTLSKEYHAGNEYTLWFVLWIINIFVWLISAGVNAWLYSSDHYAGIGILLTRILSGALVVSLIGFIGLFCVEDEVMAHASIDHYENLPPVAKKSLFLYTLYYNMFIFGTPLGWVILPIILLKFISYNIPNMILDYVFDNKQRTPKEKSLKQDSDLTNEFNQLLGESATKKFCGKTHYKRVER